MTIQQTDEITYKGELYSLVGMRGKGLFTAQGFGIDPNKTVMGAQLINTGCARGYVMKYIFINDQLILNEMMLVFCNNPIKINGVEPQSGEPHSTFEYCYKNLKLKAIFTGKLLLARSFIKPSFRLSMMFETVIEINIENGKIISIKDLSEIIGEYRKQYKAHKGPSLRQEILKELKNLETKEIHVGNKKYIVNREYNLPEKEPTPISPAFTKPPPPKDIEEWINQPFPTDSPWKGIW